MLNRNAKEPILLKGCVSNYTVDEQIYEYPYTPHATPIAGVAWVWVFTLIIEWQITTCSNILWYNWNEEITHWAANIV